MADSPTTHARTFDSRSLGGLTGYARPDLRTHSPSVSHNLLDLRTFSPSVLHFRSLGPPDSYPSVLPILRSLSVTTASVGHLQIRCNTRSDLRTCGPLVDSPATHAPAFDSRSLVDSPATHAQASGFQILWRTHRLHTPGPSIHDRSADSLATHAQTSGLTVPRSLTISWTSGPSVPQSFLHDRLDLRT